MGVAMRCGSCRDGAITEWDCGYGQKLVRDLGFTRDQSPCVATLYHVLGQLDSALVQASLGVWVESVLTTLPPAPSELNALVIERKTLRGIRKHGVLRPICSRCSVTAWS